MKRYDDFREWYNIETDRVYYTTIVWERWWRDNLMKNSKTEELIDVDISTFEILDEYYSIDKNRAYCCHWKSPDIFRPMLECIRIENIDIDTFEVLGKGYAKNKNNTFYLWKLLKGSR